MVTSGSPMKYTLQRSNMLNYQDFVGKAVKEHPPKAPYGSIHLHAFLQSTQQGHDSEGNWAIRSARWQWRVSTRVSSVCRKPGRCVRVRVYPDFTTPVRNSGFD